MLRKEEEEEGHREEGELETHRVVGYAMKASYSFQKQTPRIYLF